MNKLLCLLFSIFVFACSNKDEENLLNKIKTLENSSAITKIAANSTNLSQYKDIELKFNAQYVADLKSLIENSFNKQLEEFEDNELGFFKGYKYMFKWLFSSKTEWEDMQKQLSERYFSTLRVAQDANELGQSYLHDVETLRTRFYISKTGKQLPEIQVLSLPPSNVYLGGLDNHSANNLVIEIGEWILTSLLIIFIVWLLSLFGFIFDPSGCITIVATIIVGVASYFCTRANDSKILESLEEQHKEFTIDTNTIKAEIDTNTIQFYDENR